MTDKKTSQNQWGKFDTNPNVIKEMKKYWEVVNKSK